MGEVVITSIKNRTRETITLPHQTGEDVVIEPGEEAEGPWLYRYDESREGTVPSPNTAWFVDSPHEFKWGTVEFYSPGG